MQSEEIKLAQTLQFLKKLQNRFCILFPKNFTSRKKTKLGIYLDFYLYSEGSSEESLEGFFNF